MFCVCRLWASHSCNRIYALCAPVAVTRFPRFKRTKPYLELYWSMPNTKVSQDYSFVALPLFFLPFSLRPGLAREVSMTWRATLVSFAGKAGHCPNSNRTRIFLLFLSVLNLLEASHKIPPLLICKILASFAFHRELVDACIVR